MKSIWNLIMYFTYLRIRYERIASDPTKRETSISFGVQSIITSLIGAVIVVLCAFGISSLVTGGQSLAIVFIALLVLLMIVGLFEFTLRGLVTMIYQLRVNRHPIGWIALVMWIICVVAMVVLCIMMVSKVF